MYMYVPTCVCMPYPSPFPSEQLLINLVRLCLHAIDLTSSLFCGSGKIRVRGSGALVYYYIYMLLDVHVHV